MFLGYSLLPFPMILWMTPWYEIPPMNVKFFRRGTPPPTGCDLSREPIMVTGELGWKALPLAGGCMLPGNSRGSQQLLRACPETCSVGSKASERDVDQAREADVKGWQRAKGRGKVKSIRLMEGTGPLPFHLCPFTFNAAQRNPRVSQRLEDQMRFSDRLLDSPP